MKLLVVGSGGREHALVWKLTQSPRVQTVYVAPGNVGTAQLPKVENVPITSVSATINFCRQENIAWVVIGPEVPLANAWVDELQAAGLRAFGPTQAAAQLESSKAFAKAFMQRHAIPTAVHATFDSAAAAHDYVRGRGVPIVIKADGLAAGKGVVVAHTLAQAHEAIDAMLSAKMLGQAGACVVIEDFLSGEEASFIVMADGENVLPLASCQDHKRLLDGDQGPNTGGMGAYSPAAVVTPQVHQRVLDEIVVPTMRGMAAEGNRFVGFLYVGLMIDATGAPFVVEFNTRLGDPETQPLMSRLNSDLVELIEAALAQRLSQVSVDWSTHTAVAVVLAAEGYPQAVQTGAVITGLNAAADLGPVFYAGIERDDQGVLRTHGGRVACVVGLGDDVVQARDVAYRMADCVRFQGKHCRTDIAARAVNRMR